MARAFQPAPPHYVRFKQTRRSGGTWKFAGGNDVQVMRDSIHAMGQDIAHILLAFK